LKKTWDKLVFKRENQRNAAVKKRGRRESGSDARLERLLLGITKRRPYETDGRVVHFGGVFRKTRGC